MKYGQLGVSDQINKFSPVEIIKISGMIQISAGGYHSIFLRNNGKIYVCGRNDYGQLGLGTTNDISYPFELLSDAKVIATGAHHSSYVTKNGDIYTTGRNQVMNFFCVLIILKYGQLGIKKNSAFQTSFQILFSLGDVDDVTLGEDYSIALSKGFLYGFGNNIVKIIYH